MPGTRSEKRKQTHLGLLEVAKDDNKKSDIYYKDDSDDIAYKKIDWFNTSRVRDTWARNGSVCVITKDSEEGNSDERYEKENFDTSEPVAETPAIIFDPPENHTMIDIETKKESQKASHDAIKGDIINSDNEYNDDFDDTIHIQPRESGAASKDHKVSEIETESELTYWILSKTPTYSQRTNTVR